MANTNSFNKRELEKRREQKKKEKLRRKEERKSGASGSSLDDMIAYVDANGVISDTPPDPNLQEEIDSNDINVSVPKREEVEDVPNTGRVAFFNSSRGFGFIQNSNSGEKHFFHISNAFADIKEGQQVTFDLERSRNGGMEAVRITLFNKNANSDQQ